MSAANISLKARQLLVLLLCILILVIASLSFLDASQRLDRRRAIMEQRSRLLEDMSGLSHALFAALPALEPPQLVRLLDPLNKLEATLQDTEADSLQIRQSLEVLNLVKRRLQADGAQHHIHREAFLAEIVLLSDRVTSTCQTLLQKEHALSRSIRLQVMLTFLAGIVLVILVLALNSRYLNESMKSLMAFTQQMGKGRLPAPLEVPPGDEFESVARDLNRHINELHSKLDYVDQLAGEGSPMRPDPAEEDELGAALLRLSDTLSNKEIEKVSRNREDKKQNWISEGAARMGEVLRSQRENLEELAYMVVENLVTYMNVEMGALYIAIRNGEKETLRLMASHAYDRRKYREDDLDWGMGLPGTCAREKKRIFMTAVPEEYFEISSGTGSSRPNCILLVPLLRDDSVYGVIELATVRLLRPFEIDFVESLAESIASSLHGVQVNQRTADLLKQSQAQAEALKEQEKAMKESMKKLEEAQAESSKKESEITGILAAINNSVLVAELGVNRRYLSINDNFLELLGTQREMVLGKLHSDFARVDPYTETYKEFCKTLKEGQSMSNTEAYGIIDGKETWLRQSFTPVLNNEGKVYKILNIATDITETRKLQEQLSSKEAEINRGQLDMKSLNLAVNNALIKSEMDGEGIIMEVNDKYTEISGFSRSEVLGRNSRLFLKPSEKEQFERIWEEVCKGKTWEGVIRRSKPTGEETWIASTFAPVKDEAGQVIKVYQMGFDITEKKLKYQLLEEANREIERLREALNENEN